MTDDLGQFRVYGLMPGAYVVSAYYKSHDVFLVKRFEGGKGNVIRPFLSVMVDEKDFVFVIWDLAFEGARIFNLNADVAGFVRFSA